LRSAGIEWVDRGAVLRHARALATSLRDRCPEVRRVLLFGSFARGAGGPRSDLDLVVIVSDTTLSPRDRIDRYAPVSPRPVDLFVYTEAEVLAMAGDPPPVLREALGRGVDLI
jgi:predicted nucleotidyltransferase